MRKDTKYLLTQKEYEHTYPVTTTNPSSLNWLRWFVDWILPSTPSDVYIVMPTIDEYAKIMVQQHYKKPLCSALDNLFTWDEFKAQYRAIPCYQETCVQLSDMDLWFVLRYLVHHYGVAVQDTFKTFGHQSTVIKFPERTESERTKAVISQEDKAIVSLKAACTALHYQVDQLEIKAQEFLQVAQQHYTFHRKPQAMFMLRKKKQIEHLLEQRYKTLDTMETVLLKIEASQNDLYMVQAFNLGTETLRKMLAHHSFDKIQETMDELQEALDDHEQVEHALTQGHHVIVDQDEQALEEQLESLALEEQALTQPIDTQSELMRLQQVLSSLNVPSHTTKQKQAQLA
ncbi:Snf7-domain-containing protein [Gilbertella persicaria]|nr:Snf7-domain-containing protein [Gilbertella persicaria]KAI8066201.1 Snf7-domain-containing protein [Gilbertella persicaria]